MDLIEINPHTGLFALLETDATISDHTGNAPGVAVNS